MSMVNGQVLNPNASHSGKIGIPSEIEYLKKSEIDRDNINGIDNLTAYSSVPMNAKINSNVNTESVIQQDLCISNTSSVSGKCIPSTPISMGLNGGSNYYNEVYMSENNLNNNKYDSLISKDNYINKEMENNCLSNMNNGNENGIIEPGKPFVDSCTNEQNEEDQKYDINLNSEILNGEIVDSEILNKQMVASEILKNNILRCNNAQNQIIGDASNNLVPQINDENRCMNPEISTARNGEQNGVPVNIASGNEHTLLNSHLNNTNMFNGDTRTDCHASGNGENQIGGINEELNKIQDIKEKDAQQNDEEELNKQKTNSGMKKTKKIYNRRSKIVKSENVTESNSSGDSPRKPSKIRKKNGNHKMGSSTDAICSNKVQETDSADNIRVKDEIEERTGNGNLERTQESIGSSQGFSDKENDGQTIGCSTPIPNDNCNMPNINDKNKSMHNSNGEKEFTNMNPYIHNYGSGTINKDSKNTFKNSDQGNNIGMINQLCQAREHPQFGVPNFDTSNGGIDRGANIYPHFIYEQLSKPISIPVAGELKKNNVNGNERMYNSEMNPGYCPDNSNGGNIFPYNGKMNINNNYYKNPNQLNMECMGGNHFEEFPGYRNEMFNNAYDGCNGIPPIMNNNRFLNNGSPFGMQDIINMNSNIGNIINGEENILHNGNLDRNKLWADTVVNNGIPNLMHNNSPNMNNMFEYPMGSNFSNCENMGPNKLVGIGNNNHLPVSNNIGEYDMPNKSMQNSSNYISTDTNEDRQFDEINQFLMNNENNLHQNQMHMNFNNNQNSNMPNMCNGMDPNYDAGNIGNVENAENGKTQNKNAKNGNGTRKGGKYKKSKSFGGTIKKGGTVFNLDLESYRIKKTPLCIYSVRDICNNYKLSKKHIKYTNSYEVAVDCDCTIHHSIQCVKDYVVFLKEEHLKKKKKNEQNKSGLRNKSNSKGRKQNKNSENGKEPNKDDGKNDTQGGEAQKTDVKVENETDPIVKVPIKTEQVESEAEQKGCNDPKKDVKESAKINVKKDVEENAKESAKINVKKDMEENAEENEKESAKESAKVNVKKDEDEVVKKEPVENKGVEVKKENCKNGEEKGDGNKEKESDKEKEKNKEKDDEDDDEDEDEEEDEEEDDEDADEEEEDGESSIYNLSQCNNILYNINKIWHPGFNRPLGDVGRKLVLKEIREHHHRDPKKTTDLLLERGLDYGKVRFMRVNELYHYMYALDSFEYAIKISLEFGSNIRMSTISNRVDHASLCLNLKSGYSYCLICCSQRPDIYGLYSSINLMQNMLLLQSSYKYLNKFARKTKLPKKDKLARAMRKNMERKRNGNNKLVILSAECVSNLLYKEKKNNKKNTEKSNDQSNDKNNDKSNDKNNDQSNDKNNDKSNDQSNDQSKKGDQNNKKDTDKIKKEDQNNDQNEKDDKNNVCNSDSLDDIESGLSDYENLTKIKEALKENEEICNKYPEEDIEERHRYYMIQKNWDYKKNKINKNDTQCSTTCFDDNKFSNTKKDNTNDYIIENDKTDSYNNLDVNIIYDDNTNESIIYESANKYNYGNRYSLNENNLYSTRKNVKNNKQIYYESETEDKNEDNLHQEEYKNVNQNNFLDHKNYNEIEEDQN
ncbi:conserved Plasmodium protein, unknown function [Plasmodium vinckei vinckei]|uniref:Uncharacterized protein n=1 Tax=Plasmodium vinckei vinckei TaxID=54757 RepID=A0A449C0P6_PLAVN|nr:conserved Plasmodium protein, unknown function [Plasmodium vinckei vinckei]KEG03948.1 hypothetical protein YYE_00850 [Plasmodium vinckei vinckei]VEV59255.1 conserved Plasmodium protein, unknown function [Plasmodium vinckei vinckei]